MIGKIIGAILLACMLVWQAHGAVNCTAAGRYADTNDTTCQNYTLCVYANASTGFLAYNYTCPTTSVFSPVIGKCTASTNYVCNSTITTTGTCLATGRFANTSDTTCQTYTYCVGLTNGTFLEYNYTCPTTSVFSPIISQCTTN